MPLRYVAYVAYTCMSRSERTKFDLPAQTAAMEVEAKCSSFLSSLTAGADRVTHGLWASVWDSAKFKFWKKSEHPATAQISLGSWTWMPFSNPSWLSRATLALWSYRVCVVEHKRHEIIAKNKTWTETIQECKLFITTSISILRITVSFRTESRPLFPP